MAASVSTTRSLPPPAMRRHRYTSRKRTVPSRTSAPAGSPAISWAAPVAALIAGAIGAVVSVVQRINSGSFELDYDVGGPYIFFLGGLRPLIGGAFAVAISFAFDGGLLHLPVAASESTNDRRLALLVISFLAGFSERFAQDTLTSVMPKAAEHPVYSYRLCGITVGHPVACAQTRTFRTLDGDFVKANLQPPGGGDCPGCRRCRSCRRLSCPWGTASSATPAPRRRTAVPAWRRC